MIVYRVEDYYDPQLREIGFAYQIKNKNSTYLYIDPHGHDFYEYFFLISGQVGHIVNGRREILRRGHLVLLRPGDWHALYAIEDSDEDVELINITIAPEEFRRLEEYFGGDMSILSNAKGLPPSLEMNEQMLQSLTEAHSFLYFYPFSPEPDSYGELQRRMRFLFVRVCELFLYSGLHKPDANKEWLEKALTAMSSPENIRQGLPALLEIVGFSHGHLCKMMQKYYGTTPNRYITELRMGQAANLLRYSRMSVQEISDRVGYSNKSHFVKIFKERYGFSPLQYRKALETNKIYY